MLLTAYLNSPLFRDVYAQMGLKRNGLDLPSAYLVPTVQRAFDELTDRAAVLALLNEERRSKPEFAAWLDARFVSRLDVEELKQFPDASLGRAVYDFVAATGFNIDFMFKQVPADDLDYLNKRRVQVHDIEHIVTGLDASAVGEIALIALNMIVNQNYFSLAFAAELNRFGGFLLSTSLMRCTVHYPSVMNAYFEGLAIAREMSQRQQRPLFMMRWEDHLTRTIPELQAALGFVGAPAEGHWQWTEKAARG